MRPGWEDEDWKGLPVSKVYGSNRRWRLPKLNRFVFRPSLWTIQVLVSLFLVVLVTGIFLMDSPAADNVQRTIRYWLSNPQSDWSPAIQEAVRTGMWLDSYDRGTYRISDGGTLLQGDGKSLMTIPVSGRITREFGWEMAVSTGEKQLHGGIDITALAGSPVRAALAGRVLKLENTANIGRTIHIDHGYGLTTVYTNVAEVLVNEGQMVQQGEIIAKIGAAGNSSEGFIHFEVRKNGNPVNPLEYLGIGSGSA